MAPIEFDPTFTGHVHLHVLLGAYISMTGKAARRLPPKQEVFHDYVQKPIVSVNEKLEDILTSLKTGGHLHYRRLFSAQPTKSSAIAAFLALLELIRDHRVHMDDEGEITLITEDTP